MHTMNEPSAPAKCFPNFELDFEMKIKYNFRVQVLLCLKGTNWVRQDVLQKICQLKGYRCHKAVKHCRRNWSHLHIKFTEEQLAKNAVIYFRKYNSDLTAVIVDDLLKDWYTYERRSNFSPPWTLTIVDVVGIVPLSINLLSQYVLNNVLQDFGTPYLLPYTAALDETHVQVLFSSMTEALAACMAFGPWWTMNHRADQCFYRIRINPCHKEALLIRNSGGVPEEAFKLDYFVDPVHEINLSSLVSDYKKKESSEYYRSRGSQAEFVSSNGQKQKFAPVRSKSRRNDNSHYKICTPILCIPVMGSYSQTFSSDNGRSPTVVNSRSTKPFVTDHEEYNVENVAFIQPSHRADQVINIDHGRNEQQHQVLNPLAQTYNVSNHRLGKINVPCAQPFTMMEFHSNTSGIGPNVQSYSATENQIASSKLSSDPDIIGTKDNCGQNGGVFVESTAPELQLHSSNHTYEYTRIFSKNVEDGSNSDRLVEEDSLTNSFISSTLNPAPTTYVPQHSIKQKINNFKVQPEIFEIQK